MKNDEGRVESRLAKVLSKLNVPGRVTIQDIKDIIWNEDEPNLSSRLIFALLEEFDSTEKEREEITNVIMEAWNYYPHGSLNGLSPNEAMERSQEAGFVGDGEESTYRRDFYDVFADQFPKEPQVTNVGENDWQFEFPSTIQRLRSVIEKIDDDEDEDEYEDNEQPISDEVKIDGFEPYLFDGVVGMARDLYEEAGDYKKARQLLERSIAAGRMLLPPTFTVGKDYLRWGYLDNRPYLRLLGAYAQLVEAEEGPARSIPLYEELLNLNPNDNQGVRALLANAYLKTNQLERLCELAKQFPEDHMPEVTVGNILALIKLEKHEEAKKSIKKNVKYHEHVYNEILKTSHPQPKMTPGYVKSGGEDQAWIYWDQQGTYWMATHGAREFLRKTI